MPHRHKSGECEWLTRKNCSCNKRARHVFMDKRLCSQHYEEAVDLDGAIMEDFLRWLTTKSCG